MFHLVRLSGGGWFSASFWLGCSGTHQRWLSALFNTDPPRLQPWSHSHRFVQCSNERLPCLPRANAQTDTGQLYIVPGYKRWRSVAQNVSPPSSKITFGKIKELGTEHLSPRRTQHTRSLSCGVERWRRRHISGVARFSHTFPWETDLLGDLQSYRSPRLLPLPDKRRKDCSCTTLDASIRYRNKLAKSVKRKRAITMCKESPRAVTCRDLEQSRNQHSSRPSNLNRYLSSLSVVAKNFLEMIFVHLGLAPQVYAVHFTE